jgi:predicted small metal-binding protein
MEQNGDADVTSTQVRTMTCSQLGGPCDLAHRGDDANEIIHAQDRHLREAVAAGSLDHEPALKQMKGRWKRPISGMKWYRQVQRDFATLPDDPADR